MEFDLPVGPLADMSELLYVSALHQTSEFLREDGSISADDISRFLMSRYGVKASTDVVRDVILGGIISESGLGRENTDNGAMDLMEMVAVLFIPLFLKQAAPDNQTEGLVKACPNVVMSIAEMILHDVTGSREPKELSIDLIRNMFLKYGEKGFLRLLVLSIMIFQIFLTSELSSRQSITGVLPVLTQVLDAGSGPGFLEWLETVSEC